MKQREGGSLLFHHHHHHPTNSSSRASAAVTRNRPEHQDEYDDDVVDDEEDGPKMSMMGLVSGHSGSGVGGVGVGLGGSSSTGISVSGSNRQRVVSALSSTSAANHLDDNNNNNNRTMAVLLRPNPGGGGGGTFGSKGGDGGGRFFSCCFPRLRGSGGVGVGRVFGAFVICAIVAITCSWATNIYFLRTSASSKDVVTSSLEGSSHHHANRLPPQVDQHARQQQQQQTPKQQPKQQPEQQQEQQQQLQDNTSGGRRPFSEQKYHVVFSTGCSPYQDWQSYGFFYHVLKSGQEGHVTRIASGCSPSDAQIMEQTFQREIQNGMMMSEMTTTAAAAAAATRSAVVNETQQQQQLRFHLHLTPDFSNASPGVKYHFFNKPFGLKHWMEHGLHYKQNHDLYDDTVFILLDPDEWILRPFVMDYSHEKETWHTTKLYPNVLHTKVTHGHPISQMYLMGAGWWPKINMSQILQYVHDHKNKNSRENMDNAEVEKNTNGMFENLLITMMTPIHNWTKPEINQYYVAGPPYLATGKDMYKIVTTWSEFAVPVFQQTKHFLSEMYAYIIAAGHLQLPHQLAYSLMVSNHGIKQEGWSLIEEKGHDQGDFRINELPHVLHFCQVYSVGPYYFSKRTLPTNVFSCQHPLMRIPGHHDTNSKPIHHTDPTMIRMNMTACMKDLSQYDYALLANPRNPKDNPVKQHLQSVDVRRHHAFMLCYMLKSINDAAIYYKKTHCHPPSGVYDMSYVWPHTLKEPKGEQVCKCVCDANGQAIPSTVC